MACSSQFLKNDGTRSKVHVSRLLEFGELDLVVMTRGADGAILVTADSVIEQEGVPTTVIDTVGAGDSFTAAFLIGELKGEPHKDNLRKACEVAAAVCSHSGAVPPGRIITGSHRADTQR